MIVSSQGTVKIGQRHTDTHIVRHSRRRRVIRRKGKESQQQVTYDYNWKSNAFAIIKLRS